MTRARDVVTPKAGTQIGTWECGRCFGWVFLTMRRLELTSIKTVKTKKLVSFASDTKSNNAVETIITEVTSVTASAGVLVLTLIFARLSLIQPLFAIP